MYSCEPPHMDVQKQDDQHELTYSNYVRTQDVKLKTCRRRWMIGRSGERGSGISVLAARHDDDDDVYFVAHELLLFVHNHLAVLSVVLIIASMAFLFFWFLSNQCLPGPCIEILQWNPLEPTSIGVEFEFHPFFLHFSRSSSYLYFFRSWASSACSSDGTVNSHILILFFVFLENISISGRNNVWTIWSGNLNPVSKSALSSQSVASDSAFGALPSFGLVFTPALTNLIKFLWQFAVFVRIAVLTTSTISLNNWPWRHIYRLSASALWHILKICFSDPTPLHITDTRGVVLFHKWTFTGLGRVLYTDRIRNFMATSLCHKSDNLICIPPLDF